MARVQRTNDEARQCDTTDSVFGKLGHQDGVRYDVHGWNIALLREVAGVETFVSVESKFSFARCIRQGSAEAPALAHADPG